MPRRTPPKPIDAQARDEVGQELDDLIGRLVAELGPAEGAHLPSEADEVKLWGQTDPTVDRDALRQQLMTGTVPPELYDPQSDRRLALLRVNPDHADEWAQLFAQTAEQPLDDEMATLIAELSEYPGRLAVLAPYDDDPSSKVKKAESIDRRWRRATGMLSEDGVNPDAAMPYAGSQGRQEIE